jgi:hypothetical protein
MEIATAQWRDGWQRLIFPDWKIKDGRRQMRMGMMM